MNEPENREPEKHEPEWPNSDDCNMSFWATPGCGPTLWLLIVMIGVVGLAVISTVTFARSSRVQVDDSENVWSQGCSKLDRKQ